MKPTILFCAFLLHAFLAAPAGAQITGHYPAGIEGIKAGSLPPPGHYTKLYHLFYWANDFKDANGDSIPADPNLFVYAPIVRHLWMSDFTIMGARYGADVAVPLFHTEVEFNTPAGRLKDSRTGLGDILVEPLLLSWTWPRYQFNLGYGIFIPTGDFDASRPASTGKGFWTHMPIVGGTIALDEAKTWNFSVANRFEFNTRNDDLGITPGPVYTLESALSKSITPTFEAGLFVGAFVQMDQDSGPGAASPGVQDRVFNVGPQFDLFIPKVKGLITLKYLKDFAAVDRPEGHTAYLTFTKVW